MSETFTVTISGRSIDNVPLGDLKAGVAAAFKLEGAPLERMLSGKPLIVARNASAAAAEKLVARLHTLGLEASMDLQSAPPPAPPAPTPAAPAPQAETAAKDDLFALKPPAAQVPTPPAAAPATVGTTGTVDAVPAVAETSCPKCGETQPQRTLCRHCGLDMPRYLAAQRAADDEARAARQNKPGSSRTAARPEQRQSNGDAAGLLGIGFSGRLGRLDYLSGSLLSTAIAFLGVLLATEMEAKALYSLGFAVAAIYGLRCLALRLHDTGRTGWLSLVALVPILGALMALLLLFVPGEDDDNDYGPVPAESGGLRAIVVLLLVSGVSWSALQSVTQDPEKAMFFLAEMAGEDVEALRDDSEGEAPEARPASVRYASNNRIDIYVMSNCMDCEQMLGWLAANRLRPTIYRVDQDQHASERLHSIIGNQGQIDLPVLEINGKLLPGNPAPHQVHPHLRQE